MFKRKHNTPEYDESSWDKILEEKSELDMKDPVVREQYVMNCLEQMHDASTELDRINNEYAVVTGYLTDMEDVESLPKDVKDELSAIAGHIKKLRQNHDAYVLKPSLMTEEEFGRMERIADIAEEGIEKLSKEEDYKEKVKRDLKRIDKERNAYEFRRRDITASIDNSRGVATIVMVSAVLLIVILFALQILLHFDVTIGYYLTVIFVAVAVTVIYLKYADRVREKKSIDNTINELILLENKVKIRYVNNKNLLDYLYTKYDVSSAAELEDLFERYQKEKVDRREFAKNQAAYEDELERLLAILKKQKLSYPDVWIHQTDALQDPREMVEIRPRLIGRRQKLRKQLEYNESVAIEAGDEIKTIIKDYPEYAESILKIVNQYES
ncbi:MAG: hypothetical protein K6E19_03490 [Lachnospiraceae bacterium]|nr:hypothetical protein [Lachnospiraceae bacterium]